MERSLNSIILILTNLCYLVPVLVTAFKVKKSPRGVLFEEGVILIVFLLITFFTSWSYHECRGDTLRNMNSDIKEVSSDVHIPPCTRCKDTTMNWVQYLPWSDDELTFNALKFADYFMAMYALILCILYVLPLKECVKRLFIVTSTLWLVLFLSAGNDRLSLAPLLLLLIMLAVFWYFSAQCVPRYSPRNVVWGLSLGLFVMACVFFEIDKEPYWLKHSLWHICGAFGLSLLLSKSAARFEDIDIDRFKEVIPDDLRGLFKYTRDVCYF